MMWLIKFGKKHPDDDTEPLERYVSDEQLNARRHLRLLQTFVNAVAVVTQCFLIAFIILSLMLFFAMLGDKKNWPQMDESTNIRYERLFEQFIISYNKSYTSDEKAFRYSVFITNVAYFEEEELKHPEVDLGITRFADWTDEEMIKILSGDSRETLFDGAQQRFDGSALDHRVRRPVEVDWVKAGKVTPVKDQGQCGSCWAFATVASVESVYAIKIGEMASLSEQELVDCDSQNNGCQGGFRPYAMSFVKKYGLMKEVEYPYCGTDHNKCELKMNSTGRVFIDDYRSLSSDEEVIADWISDNGPLTFGMNVTKSLYSYRDGIFSPSKEDCEERSLGSHALTIVGYGVESNGGQYWLVKNSWGSRWGRNGYFKLARGRNACGAANTVVVPFIKQK